MQLSFCHSEDEIRRISHLIRFFELRSQNDRLSHCEVGFSVGHRGTKCPSPLVGTERYSGDNPNNPIRCFATKQSIDRGQASPSAMTCDRQDMQEPVIAHSVARSFSWIASLTLAMTPGGIASGERARSAIVSREKI